MLSRVLPRHRGLLVGLALVVSYGFLIQYQLTGRSRNGTITATKKTHFQQVEEFSTVWNFSEDAYLEHDSEVGKEEGDKTKKTQTKPLEVKRSKEKDPDIKIPRVDELMPEQSETQLITIFPLVTLSMLPLNTGIYFLETDNAAITFQKRHLCAFESAAMQNPGREVYVLIDEHAKLQSVPGYL